MNLPISHKFIAKSKYKCKSKNNDNIANLGESFCYFNFDINFKIKKYLISKIIFIKYLYIR